MRRITEDEIRKISPEHFEAFSNELEKASKTIGDVYYYVNAIWDTDVQDDTSTPDDPIYAPIWSTFQDLRKDFAKKTRVGDSSLELDLLQETVGTQGEFTEFCVCGSVIETLSPAGEKLKELLNS